MDGYTGLKTATAEDLPDAVAVVDPFHARGHLGIYPRMIGAYRQPDHLDPRALVRGLIGSVYSDVPQGADRSSRSAGR